MVCHVQIFSEKSDQRHGHEGAKMNLGTRGDVKASSLDL
jgi:hypothetical protein